MNRLIYILCLVLILGFSTNSLATQGHGNVYAATNDPTNNQVAIYERNRKGEIYFVRYIDTGGLGAGDNAPIDSLGSQNSVLLSEDKRNLFVVNAGSNEISVFRVRRSGDLRLIQTIGSGGDFPVSLTIDDDLLYVLNAGGAGNIVGYKVHRNGTLSVINESIRSLGLNNPVFPDGTEVPLTPGQVGFDRKNRRLIITNAGDRELLVFDLNRNGIPEQTPSSTRSEGDVPFDFVIARNGTVLVTEAAGSASSYRFTRDNTLLPISSAVANGQQASCWIVSNGSRFAFTINTGSSTISTYQIERGGELSLENAVGADLNGGLPTDATITRNGRLLYVLNAGTGDVSAYRVNRRDGSLRFLNASAGLPNFSDNGVTPQGIAVR